MSYYRMRTEGFILQDTRQILGITQQQVADKAQIQLRQYQRNERGERNLSSTSFYIASKVLQVLGLDATKYADGGNVLSDEPVDLRQPDGSMKQVVFESNPSFCH